MKKFVKQRWFQILWVLIVLLALITRLVLINQVPPSPYWEEVALGYDAYSIAQTARDHHGHFLPMVAFESFGDFKPAGYFYTVVPFIKIFGLSILAVRLPSVLSGVLIVIGVGKLMALLVDNSKDKKIATALAMAITAVSPWAIQFSRGGWEVNLATCLLLWGVVFLLSSLQKEKLKLEFIAGGLLLVLSMYVYHATRVIAPMLGIWLMLVWLVKGKKADWFQKIKLNLKPLLTAVIVLSIVALPIFLALGNNQINQRFKETSIFYDLEPIISSNQAKKLAANSLFSRIIYHRYVLFGQQVLTNFFNHFSLDFLFLSGDLNPRHSTTYVGLFYYLDFFLLILGIYYLARTKPRLLIFLVGWLVIGILPSALSKASPHSLRILPTLPVWMTLITFGLVYLIKPIESLIIKIFKKKAEVIQVVTFSGLLFVYLIQVIIWARFYFFVYPVKYQSEWQYGYQQLVAQINQQQVEHPDLPIYVSRNFGRPAMYYWFYSKTDPKQVQQLESTAKKDQAEFLEFNKIKFESWDQQTSPAIVAITSDESIDWQKYQFSALGQVRDLSGQIVWGIYLIEGSK